MNFFGHAVVASWRSDEPSFGLGAMLPDFASIIGARVVDVRHEDTARGVAWHHHTDAAFHRLETFRTLSSQLTSRLSARGLGRGGALAAGHVGVELILDGLLLESSLGSADELYLQAVAAAPAIGDDVELQNRRPHPATPAERFLELVSFLDRRGLPHGYKDPATVAERVLRVVAHRPRLAIDPAHESALASELERVKDLLEPRVSPMLDELRTRLDSANL